MKRVEIHTQADLDNLPEHAIAVIRSGHYCISDNATADVYGNATAYVSGNATAYVSGNARVYVRGNARADVSGNARADVYGNATADVYGNATANVYDNARVYVYGNARAYVRGNARADVSGNARADVSGNATAYVSGNATVYARDFATVYERSHNGICTAVGEARIIKPIYSDTIEEWCALKGIEITAGTIKLYKAVREDGTDFYSGKINYLGGGEVVAPDWDADYEGECGFGLHLSDSPAGARFFVRDHLKGYKLLRVRVRTEDCRVFGGSPDYPMKIRARACEVIEELPDEAW